MGPWFCDNCKIFWDGDYVENCPHCAKEAPKRRDTCVANLKKAVLDSACTYWTCMECGGTWDFSKGRIPCPHCKARQADTVNHPLHYNQGKFEVIDVIEDWKLDFNLGNAVKYIARAEHKGKREEDLKKALWYLERALGGKGN